MIRPVNRLVPDRVTHGPAVRTGDRRCHVRAGGAAEGVPRRRFGFGFVSGCVVGAPYPWRWRRR
ncbi:hypothetical protein GCM10009548_62540 [Streptomyces malaysiensis subsp. malaysiensis]